MPTIDLGHITADVELKDIKNIHLSVYPPIGRVRIAAPTRMDLETIRMFAISKLGWIKQQQTKFRNQKREAPKTYVSRESHYFLGKRYLMQVKEADNKPIVTIKHDKLILQVRPSSTLETRQKLVQEFYRDELRSLALPIIALWERRLKVSVQDLGIRRMKTKWGTCNEEVGRIWLNLELAKKPIACIEYIVVHEMTHLLERNHNKRFVALMDKHMPGWREVREELNGII